MQSVNLLSTIPKIEIPSSVNELGDLKQLETKPTLIAGGTLLQVQWETGVPVPSHLISIESLQGLRGIIKLENERIEVGALTTLSTCERDPLLREYATVLVEACRHIASPAVRNRGTLGGNICSGKGDSIPALLSLNTEIKYYNGKTFETIPLEQWIESSVLNQKFILTHIIIPMRKTSDKSVSFFRKVGRREAFTAALVTVAIHCEFEEAIIKEVRLCIGGGDHIAHRLKNSESFIKNSLSEQTDVQKIYKHICNEVKTYSDAFGTADYRKRVASNIILAFLADQLAIQKG
jgi:xanthine dehydrogenase C subunit